MNENPEQEKIRQLQLSEQKLQNLLMQKQQFQVQLNDVDSASAELKNSKQSYKIIGTVMVKKESAELEKELEEKRKIVELRIKSLEKQEDNIRQKAKQLQEEVLGNMNKK